LLVRRRLRLTGIAIQVIRLAVATQSMRCLQAGSSSVRVPEAL